MNITKLQTYTTLLRIKSLKLLKTIKKTKVSKKVLAIAIIFLSIAVVVLAVLSVSSKDVSVSTPDIWLSPTTTIALTPTSTQPENTPAPTSVPARKPTPKPTVINKPVSVVDENVLRTKFSISSSDLIASILGDSGKLESYEREYYNQLKGWPELKTTAVEQRIYIPSLNSTKICKTTNITEIKNASIEVEKLRTKKEVIFKKSQIKPLVKPAYAACANGRCDSPEEYDAYIKSLDYEIKKISEKENILKELIIKYCRVL